MTEYALTRIHIEDVGQAYCVGRLGDFKDKHIASFLGTGTQVYLGACTQTTEPLTLTRTPGLRVAIQPQPESGLQNSADSRSVSAM